MSAAVAGPTSCSVRPAPTPTVGTWPARTPAAQPSRERETRRLPPLGPMATVTSRPT